MKILRVISSTNPAGGGPIEGLLQVSRQLAQRGHQTEVVTLDDPGAAWLADAPFPTHALGPSRLGYRYTEKLVPWLQDHVDRFDCVIVHGLWQYPGYGTWRALRRSNKPYFVFPHGMLDPWFKHTYPLKHLKKSLYWWSAERRVLHDARAVLFTCEEERMLARQSFWPYRCVEEVVTYGTSDPLGDAKRQQAMFLERFPHLRDQRLVLFLGRIHEKKGCDLLIRAFHAVAQRDPSLRLVLAGPDQGGLRSELERLTATLGMTDRVTWTGMLQGDLKWGAMHAAEVFALPSHQENFGIAVVEALACGLPVLISRKVNIWRELEQAQAGLTGHDDVEGTRDLLERWLAMSPDDHARMRTAARTCFLDRFESKRVAESLITTLQRQGVQERVDA